GSTPTCSSPRPGSARSPASRCWCSPSACAAGVTKADLQPGEANMNAAKNIAIAFALTGLLGTGCAGEPPAPATGEDAAAAESFIGRQVARGIAQAQRELETGNIRLGSNNRILINARTYGTGRAADGLPKAEITPQGALLIDGEQVPATAEQHGL